MVESLIRRPRIDYVDGKRVCLFAPLSLEISWQSLLPGVFFPCTQASRARLFKEFKEVQRDNKLHDSDIQLLCNDTNIYRWIAHIKVSAQLGLWSRLPF